MLRFVGTDNDKGQPCLGFCITPEALSAMMDGEVVLQDIAQFIPGIKCSVSLMYAESDEVFKSATAQLGAELTHYDPEKKEDPAPAQQA